MHTWPEHGYAAIDIFTCSQDEQKMPCPELVAAVYRDGAWECADGSRAVAPQGGLWLAMQAILTRMRAHSGQVTWLERGPKLLAARHRRRLSPTAPAPHDEV